MTAPPPVSDRAIRVLIAEDDDGMRAALEALVGSDATLELVASACDARTAIVAAERTAPDVCVIDVTMPGGGGVHATREIRAALPDARVVVLSGREDRETVLAMLRAGATGYVVKGSEPEEVLEAIRRTSRGESTLSRAVTDGVVGALTATFARDEDAERRRERLVERLRAAIDGDLLAMAYQPIVDLRTRRTVGFEALARFQADPPRPTDEWFREAGEVGLLLELELAAVRRGLRALDRLADGTYLTVNASPSTLLAPRFLSTLFSTGAGERLVVEVTEHAPIQDYDAVGAALGRLRAHGVRLAVDDAGAGFASLRHIVRLAPDIIKIDGALTREVDRDRSQRAVTSALISFARETGATIVAEGLETEDQIRCLTGLGVRLGQGFRLGRPAPLGAAPPPLAGAAS